MTSLKLALAAVLMTASPAEAATYKFAYTAVGGGVLAGRLTGSLQADGNTVLLDGVTGLITFNSVAGPALPVLTTGSTFYGTPVAPSVTFDGSVLDFFAATDETGEFGVLFDPFVVDFHPLASTSAEFGALHEDYTFGSWSLTAVPEPATWGLMIAGFAMTGVVARRRRGIVTA